MKVFIDTNVILEYFMHREECLQNLRIILNKILQMFDVAEHDKDSLLRGVADKGYKDIEDSCQHQVAQKVGCEALVSFNISDFSSATDGPVRIFTPQQFIDHVLTE